MRTLAPESIHQVQYKMMSRHGGKNYARDVYRTKRRDAEFAEKNAEINEAVN